MLGYAWLTAKPSESLEKNSNPIPVFTDTVSNAVPDFKNYPAPDTLFRRGKAVVAEYSRDPKLQSIVAHYLEGYKPGAGVYAICDLKSGKVLAIGERLDSLESYKPNLIFGKNFPAASLVKIVTALAALKSGVKPKDSLTIIGSYHTLYKRQLRPDKNLDYKKLSLQYAFARSVNPSFGLLGFALGGQRLNAEANLLGFNSPRREGRTTLSHLIYPDTGYHLAELSCGFTRKATISPLHALEIIRALGDNGRRKPIGFYQSRRELETGALMRTTPKETVIASDKVLNEMRSLLEASVTKGTCRKSFHWSMRRDELDKLIIGAKTGSLDGDDPKGRYDWFVGYAKKKDTPENGIALVILQIHQEYQTLISSRIAALIIKSWARQSNSS